MRRNGRRRGTRLGSGRGGTSAYFLVGALTLGTEGGAGGSSRDLRESIEMVITKSSKRELEGRLQHQSPGWFVIGRKMSDLHLKC